MNDLQIEDGGVGCCLFVAGDVCWVAIHLLNTADWLGMVVDRALEALGAHHVS